MLKISLFVLFTTSNGVENPVTISPIPSLEKCIELAELLVADATAKSMTVEWECIIRNGESND